MQASTAFWHFVNFVLPALVTAGVTALLSRRLFERPTGLLRCWAIASAAALAGSVLGLLVFAQDGTIAGYALMLAACCGALLWLGRRKSV